MTNQTPVATEPKPLSEAVKRLTLDRISKARLTVASFCRFFGHLILKTKSVVAHPEHKVPTAAVSPDGTIYYNPDFVKTLSDAELCGLVIHETMHPALLCWRREGSRKSKIAVPCVCQDPSATPPPSCPKCPNCQCLKCDSCGGKGFMVFSLWNLAHDLSFNPSIEELANSCKANGKIKLPKNSAIDPNFKNWAAERIYDDLLAKALKNKKSYGAGSLPGGTIGVLSDSEAGGEGEGVGNDLRPDLSDTETGKRAARGDKAAQQKLANDWRVRVVAAAMAHQKKHGRGHLPAGFQKLVDELTESKIDWVEVLSQWIGENGNRLDITYRRPSRRSESAGAFLPSFVKFGVDDVIVIWDTSGSMNGRETEILSEIQGICEELGLSLRIICIDTVIHSDIRDVKQALDMIGEIKGGGGSDFCPAFELLEEEQYQGVVVAFTDGAIGVPETKPPLIKDVLWVLEPSSSKHSWGDQDPTNGSWGQVLYMED